MTVYIKTATSKEKPTQKGYYFTDCGRVEFNSKSEICNMEWDLYDWWLKEVSIEQPMRAAFQAGARRGYDQRSIMAGAKGLNEPDEDTYINSLNQ